MDRFKRFLTLTFLLQCMSGKEAVLSSQIEGTQSSLQDVLAAEARILSPRRPNDVAVKSSIMWGL